MSWKHIKTVLIFLFLIINAYLLYTSPNSFIHNKSNSAANMSSVSKTVQIIKKNYAIDINSKIIPENIENLKNVNAENIIYTDKFNNSKYDFSIENGRFETLIKTQTYSYNKTNAKKDVAKFMAEIGIEEKNYYENYSISDSGLVCTVTEKLSDYSVFNSNIKITFSASTMSVSGKWYVPENTDIHSGNSSTSPREITGIIIDVAEKIANDNTGKSITDIKHGYYISYYDENTVSKSASAIPCYMVVTDSGYKYYYDAINGKTLKQEE